VSGHQGPDRQVLLASVDGTFAVAVDRLGARVSSLVHAASGTEFLLATPWAGEDFSGGYSSDRSNEEWHRRYAGGWHTLLPHAGDARTLDGVQHPFHGEAAWRPWRLTERDATSCTFDIVLRTVPFAVRRRLAATSAGLQVTQSITNLSGRDIAFSWTEHPALSGALIGPRSSLSIDGDEIELVFPDADESFSGFCTVPAAGRSSVRLHNDDTGTAIVLRWNPELFPYLYVWQEHRDTAGFPWWGRVDTIALEPASRPYDADAGSLGPLTLAGDATLSASFALEPSVCETAPISD